MVRITLMHKEKLEMHNHQFENFSKVKDSKITPHQQVNSLTKIFDLHEI